MSGLRERRHAETRQAIVEAAFTLFERHGFSETVMERIAEHAGVSRSTLYRRYSSKEEIVLDVPRRWLSAWDAAMVSLDPAAGLRDGLRAGCLAVAAEIDDESDRVLVAFRALAESPALEVSGAAGRDWVDRMAALIAAKEPALDRSTTMTIAGAYMGAIDTMMREWAAAGGEGSVVEATDAVLDRLAPILP